MTSSCHCSASKRLTAQAGQPFCLWGGGPVLDQVHEKSDVQDIKELLQEIFKLQEMILRRLEQLERAVEERNR